MEGPSFELQTPKVERRESAEMLADLEAVREAAEELWALEADGIEFKSKGEVQPYIEAYEASVVALDEWGDRNQILTSHGLHVFPGSSRLQ